MSNWFMVTAVGNDQPGIVARVSRALADGSWGLGESSMTRLGGNFSIMMMVEGTGDETTLARLLEPVGHELGLHVHIDRAEPDLHHHPDPNVQIRVYGADRTGIVADVTGGLAAAGFTILDLNAEVSGTDGEPVYVMILDGFVTNGVEALEQVVTELNSKGLKVDMEPVDILLG